MWQRRPVLDRSCACTDGVTGEHTPPAKKKEKKEIKRRLLPHVAKKRRLLVLLFRSCNLAMLGTPLFYATANLHADVECSFRTPLPYSSGRLPSVIRESMHLQYKQRNHAYSSVYKYLPGFTQQQRTRNLKHYKCPQEHKNQAIYNGKMQIMFAMDRFNLGERIKSTKTKAFSSS